MQVSRSPLPASNRRACMIPSGSLMYFNPSQRLRLRDPAPQVRAGQKRAASALIGCRADQGGPLNCFLDVTLARERTFIAHVQLPFPRPTAVARSPSRRTMAPVAGRSKERAVRIHRGGANRLALAHAADTMAEGEHDAPAFWPPFGWVAINWRAPARVEHRLGRIACSNTCGTSAGPANSKITR